MEFPAVTNLLHFVDVLVRFCLYMALEPIPLYSCIEHAAVVCRDQAYRYSGGGDINGGMSLELVIF